MMTIWQRIFPVWIHLRTRMATSGLDRTLSSSVCWQHALLVGSSFPDARDGLACAVGSTSFYLAVGFYCCHLDSLTMHMPGHPWHFCRLMCVCYIVIPFSSSSLQLDCTCFNGCQQLLPQRPHSQTFFIFPLSQGAALVTACEASAVRVAMPTLLDEAMQTAMKSVTDLQKGHAHSLPRAVEHWAALGLFSYIVTWCTCLSHSVGW